MTDPLFNFADQMRGQIAMDTDPNRVVIDGVEMHLREDRSVSWCSDWTRIWKLGLRRESYGPATYGHTEFFVDCA